ncbi:MAG: type II toxin-antitoxin system VapC family toxin [bacterium]
MDWVMDCYAASALFLPDESSVKVKSFLGSLPGNYSLWVPALWWHEMTNVLLVAERQGRLNRLEIPKIILLFGQFNLNTDHSHGVKFSSRIYELASTYQLTAYDTTYLELAMRKEARLISLNRQLLSAAQKAGVEVFISSCLP